MEEIIEKETVKDVVKEVKIPQARVLYPFTGSGITINKDEVNSIDLFHNDVKHGNPDAT